MIEEIAKKLVKIKKEFVRVYTGISHIQEVVPLSRSDAFPIDEKHLELLHLFATKNPIYYNSYEQTIEETPCIVYEGDINEYWINSIQHDSSHAPFSPTWITSAYIACLFTKTLGYSQILDIGSGDGRIAYCAKILGLDSHAIELDDILVDLQKLVSDSTGINFNPNCSDAILFDYNSLDLSRPAFFIGGLAKMGGDVLAARIIEKLDSSLKANSGMILAGSLSQKYLSDDMSHGGWGKILSKYNLRVINTITLPTVWTFSEPDDTPYIFAKFN